MASICIVDDDLVSAEAVRLSLMDAGHRVETFPRGQDLLDITVGPSPDLILLDLHMPGLSGIDVLEQLKSDDIWPETAILMLTGSDDSHHLTEAHRLGANGYLAKPFNMGQLMRNIARVLSDERVLWLDDYHSVSRSERVLTSRPALAATG